MGWTVSHERLPSIYVLSYVLADFPFFQNASNYVIPQFPWLPSGQPTTNLEVSLITRPSTLLQSC